MKRIKMLLVAGLLLGAGLTACGGDDDKVAYRPVSFGADGHCYYVHDQAEVVELQNAGLCERSWAPMLIPQPVHMMYFPYYSSPAYYGAYVPPATRTVFIERQRSFGEQHRTQIATAAKKATYLGSNGKKVAADKIGAAKYGSGARFGPPGTKFGGGVRTADPKAPTPSPKANAPKSDSKPKMSPPPKSPSSPKSGGVKSGGSGVKTGGGGGVKSGGYGGGKR